MIKDIEGLLRHVETEIRNQCDVAIIGLSGGADSTLVATLCSRALGPKSVIGVHMPYSQTDTKGTNFNARSVRLAMKLGLKQEYIPVTEITTEIIKCIQPASGSRFGITQLDNGNARARARMCVLYGLAGVYAHNEYSGLRVRVVGTGNLSEDFIGYDTKGGDALVDFNPIGRLFKSEVYQLLDYLISKGILDEDHVDRVPSAGLWDGQTDESEIGHSYNAMEPAIRAVITTDRMKMFTEPPQHDGKDIPVIVDFVVKRHLANKHKHQITPSFDVEAFVD